MRSTEAIDAQWRIDSRKYDGSAHREWTRCKPLVLPSPSSGHLPAHALLIPAGTPVRERSGHEWSSDYDVVAYFYPRRHYQVMSLYKSGGTEFYCNCCALPEIDGENRVIRYVDMDLDVFVDRCYAAKVLDEAEFGENATRFAYPRELVDRIRKDLLVLLGEIRYRRGVFSPQFDCR